MPHDLLFVNSSIIVGWRVEVETVIYVDIFKKNKELQGENNIIPICSVWILVSKRTSKSICLSADLA